MKFKYLLLLAFSVWLVGVTTSIAAPLRAGSRLLTVARLTPEAETAQDTYRNCQTKSPAVVTVYAGNETGSGSIVSPDGLVITSNHVIKDRASNQPIVARTADGEQYRGRVVKVDTRNDLALLQLDAQNQFPIVPLASASDVQLGQSVCAIGSPYGRPGVLSKGTLSLVKRNGDLQASIRLHPGNSGGPLLNPQGAMIGVNKAILESPSGKNTGISFATNVQAVRNLLGSSFVAQAPGTSISPAPTKPSIVDSPTTGAPAVESPAAEWTWMAPETANQPITPSPSAVSPIAPKATRPTIGRRLGMTIDRRNLVVQQVQAGSAAAMGGFRPGDRLLAVNGNWIGGFTALQSFLDQQPDVALFTIARGQKVASVQVRF
jgi:serine protease Do